MKSLIIRNVHKKKMDVSLGDLAYKIPYGQARNLFSRSARLLPKNIENSFKSGSLRKRIRQGVLMVVKDTAFVEAPRIRIANPDAIVFPQKTKSFIIIEPEKVKEELHDMILAEDEELLEELENSNDEEAENKV
jgi:hypothetical protein